VSRFSEIIEENKEVQMQRKYFQIRPLEGKLVSHIKFEAAITFTPTRVMILDKLPVFRCFLIDPFHQILLKSVDIYISARVFLSKFEMCPYPEIYFGYQTVGSERMHTFQIFNKGKFDFNYVIKNYHEKEKEKKKKRKGELKVGKNVGKALSCFR
jgi:hypothetical protein